MLCQFGFADKDLSQTERKIQTERYSSGLKRQSPKELTLKNVDQYAEILSGFSNGRYLVLRGNVNDVSQRTEARTKCLALLCNN